MKNDNRQKKTSLAKLLATEDISVHIKKVSTASFDIKNRELSLPDWKDIEYHSLKNGNPIIKNCISNLDCEIIDKIKKGDHIIFICQVSQVINNDKLKPLIYYNSKYF